MIARGRLPGAAETGRLLVHRADGAIVKLQRAHFGAAGFLIEGAEIHAEILVLLLELFELPLQFLGPLGRDLHLPVQVLVQILDRANSGLMQSLFCDDILAARVRFSVQLRETEIGEYVIPG